ncbi:hypothetical protein [Rubellicoccus peritrichatus]|uniref:Uncharacterized protein n=1 Tax=Rubellicoccus peritrichatus TaxID=3080537 RepID=A0AAQ3LEK6_9BACT|nr:hypothetical protein [Puniceicoccus sp. CR14]WOO43134.1 hypothetical protein RZN69_08515 [Puniceicoccus sp. CR14]
MNDLVLKETIRETVRDTFSKMLMESARPWVSGDQEAALYVGFKSRDKFKTWADKWGVVPRREDGINLWKRSDLNKAAEKAHRPTLKEAMGLEPWQYLYKKSKDKKKGKAA